MNCRHGGAGYVQHSVQPPRAHIHHHHYHPTPFPLPHAMPLSMAPHLSHHQPHVQSHDPHPQSHSQAQAHSQHAQAHSQHAQAHAQAHSQHVQAHSQHAHSQLGQDLSAADTGPFPTVEGVSAAHLVPPHPSDPVVSLLRSHCFPRPAQLHSMAPDLSHSSQRYLSLLVCVWGGGLSLIHI